MGTTRFTGTFYSVRNVKYTVNIIDTSYSSDAITMQIISLNMNCPCEGEDRFNPILETSYSIGMINNSAAVDTFITDIVVAQEGRFFMQVYKNDVFEWCGGLVLDIMQKKDESKPSDLNLTFTDGLKRLQDIEFLDSGSLFTGSLVFKDIIIDALKLAGTYNYWDDDSLFLMTAVDWWEDGMPARAEGTDPLAYSRCYARLFYNAINLEAPDGAIVTAWSCYDVLKEIARCFGARLFLSDGMFNFIQVNEYADVSTYVRYYATDKSLTDTDTVDFFETVDQSNIAKLATGVDFYYPPLKQVIIEINRSKSGNIFPPDGNTDKNGDYDGGTVPTVATYQVCGDVLKDDMVAVLIDVNELYVRGKASDPTVLTASYKVSFKVDSTETYKIVTSASSHKITTIKSSSRFNQLVVISEPFAAAGELSIKIEIFQPTSLDASSDFTFRYWDIQAFVVRNNLLLVSNDIIAENTGATGNTYIKRYDLLNLGYGVMDNVGRITTTNDLSNWYLGYQWGVAAATRDTQITEVLAQQILSGQKIIRAIMKCSIYDNGSLSVLKCLVYDSKYYVFVGGQYDCYNDEFNGEWFEVATSTSDIVVAGNDKLISKFSDMAIGNMAATLGDLSDTLRVSEGKDAIEVNAGVLTFFNAKADGTTLTVAEAKYINTLDATSGNVNVSLPNTLVNGLTYKFLCLNAANTPKITPNAGGGDTIEGGAEYVFTASESASFVYILSSNNWKKI
jgi:hypothetical protein